MEYRQRWHGHVSLYGSSMVQVVTFASWLHQAITWTSIDLSLMVSSGIHWLFRVDIKACPGHVDFVPRHVKAYCYVVCLTGQEIFHAYFLISVFQLYRASTNIGWICKDFQGHQNFQNNMSNRHLNQILSADPCLSKNESTLAVWADNHEGHISLRVYELRN